MFRGFTRNEHVAGLGVIALVLGGAIGHELAGRGETELLLPDAPAAVVATEAGRAAPAPASDGLVGGLVDINSASAEVLDAALPGIGPVKAQSIVAYREAHGPFHTPGDLQKVRGIGEKTVASLAPLVTCGGFEGAGPAPWAADASTMARAPLPLAPPAPARDAIIDINSATLEELDSLDGIGEALATRILADRLQHGRFRSVDDLARVPGIGEKTIAKNRHRLAAH
jgi:competence protein ComEA